MFTELDTTMMHAALAQAEAVRFITSPNPRVGCVLAQGGRIIGLGGTQAAGGAHAEVMALHDAAARGEATHRATAYVTLEPCSHTGRTGPCTDALIAAGIQTVYVAIADPNPLVNGQGIARLRAAGVAVHLGLLAEQALQQNLGFFKRHALGSAWLRLKVASSLDGLTALPNGQSQWITGTAARQDNHRWRASSCAVLTGVGTVRLDDPHMNVRLSEPHVNVAITHARQPLRVVFDSQLRINPHAKILQGKGAVVCYAAAASANLDAALATLHAHALDVCALQIKANAQGRIDLGAALKRLSELPLNELHLEAGATLNGAFVQAGLVDELLHYQAPVLLGAGRGVAQFGVADLAAAPRWQRVQTYPVGEDTATQYYNPVSYQQLKKLCLPAS